MILYNLKIVLRNFKKQKTYSLVTISGLVIGLTIFILFALMAETLSNFDVVHKNRDRIYAVVQVLPGGLNGDQHSAITPSPLLPALVDEFNEIEAASRYYPPGRMIVKYDEKIFYESGLRYVDSEFFINFHI